jgi:hypothetical protein
VRQIVRDQDYERTVDVDMGLKFVRDKHTWTITTEPNRKRYRMTFDKRIVCEDLSTMPFGYKY